MFWIYQSATEFVGAGLYTLVLGLLLCAVYAFPYLNFGRINRKGIYTVQEKIESQPSPLGQTDNDEALEVSRSTLVSKVVFPRSWWVDEKTFQLERRAIFSKTWLFVTHASRFQKAGDYRTFDIAGFSFIIILGKDKQLRGFHNVCRHRAYAVTKKEYGSSIVLGCRYHGWSYNTRGELIKAPEFENVEGFDKGMNGLWELKLEVKDSLVFVNFDTSATVEELELEHASKISKWNVRSMYWLAEFRMEGKFNWKLAEGKLFFQNKMKSSLKGWSRLRRAFENRHEEVAPSYSVTLVKLATGKFLSIRLLPQSKRQTTVECNWYARSPNGLVSAETEIEALKSLLQSQVFELEIHQRKLLSSKTEFHSTKLDEIQKILEDHLDAEKRAGVEIHPAARKQSVTQDGQDDDDLCRDLESASQNKSSFCDAKSKGELEW